MADSNIGALPLAPNMADDSLLVMEQQGTAMKLTGGQLKDYAKQGVELEFQDYLDEAKKAAASAAGAVSAVTGMTVEAQTLGSGQPATVTKTTKNGKVNLAFGLPRGEQGVPGPAGATGPRGPQGNPGNGLTLLGHYDTEAELRAAVPAPKVGDAYSVGEELPYDTYIFDGVINDWKNHGPLSGGGGGTILPENVVTTEGGASIEMEGGFGEAPHTITITGEEMPPLTAEDVAYGDSTVQEAMEELFNSVSDGKQLIASAVTDKGVPTAQDATFAQMAENIGQITTGSDTADATATPGDILAPKTAYTKSGKVEGIIPSLPAQTITPGTAAKTIANGQYLSGTQTIKGDPNLVSSNIRKGVSIFGVPGAVESSFAATLTVKADVGAVVTATCGDTTVEALSTMGTVVMELPIEGTWKVTAVRGMAQYNTATIVVSSQYSAELTATLHIEYYGTTNPLSKGRDRLAATTVGSHALFAGGTAPLECSAVDAYDTHYTRTSATDLSEAKYRFAAATVGDYAIFAGAYPNDSADAYNGSLTHSTIEPLSETRWDLAATAIGDYVLFGGGGLGDSPLSTVDAYSKTLVRSTRTVLASPALNLAAASNDNYAIFAGGRASNTEALDKVTAYNKSLSRSTPAVLSTARAYLAAARAGSYVVFAGGGLAGYSSTLSKDSVDAYDLFLTRTTVEALSVGRESLAAGTVEGFAVFAGGRSVRGSSNISYVGNVDVYDPYLVHTTVSGLPLGRERLAASTIGKSILFSGGHYWNYTERGDAYANNVDVYQYK